MHELSIASSLVDMVTEAAEKANARRVIAVHVRLGALAAVDVESLRFCFSIATEGTLLANSRLEVQELPIVVHCAPCALEIEPISVQRFECPVCGTPSADIRQGKELEVASIEIDDQ